MTSDEHSIVPISHSTCIIFSTNSFSSFSITSVCSHPFLRPTLPNPTGVDFEVSFLYKIIRLHNLYEGLYNFCYHPICWSLQLAQLLLPPHLLVSTTYTTLVITHLLVSTTCTTLVITHLLVSTTYTTLVTVPFVGLYNLHNSCYSPICSPTLAINPLVDLLILIYYYILISNGQVSTSHYSFLILDICDHSQGDTRKGDTSAKLILRYGLCFLIVFSTNWSIKSFLKPNICLKSLKMFPFAGVKSKSSDVA